MRITIMVVRRRDEADPPARRFTKRSVTSVLLAGAITLAACGVALASGPRPSHQGTAGFHWNGHWRRGVTYRAGDAVFYDGSSYIATATSSGQPPSLSSRSWAVLAAAGRRGPAGPAGPAGADGTLAYAEFYQAYPSGNDLSVGDDVSFSAAGPSSGSVITQTSATVFELGDAGTYEVSYRIPVFGGEFELTVGSTTLTSTAVSSYGGPDQEIVADDIIHASTADETLSVTAAGPDTYVDGGDQPGDPSVAAIVIKLLSRS